MSSVLGPEICNLLSRVGGQVLPPLPLAPGRVEQPGRAQERELHADPAGAATIPGTSLQRDTWEGSWASRPQAFPCWAALRLARGSLRLILR